MPGSGMPGARKPTAASDPQATTGRLVRDSEQGHQLLVRDVDVEVLKSRLFTSDIVGTLKPLLDAEPDVRIYKAA